MRKSLKFWRKQIHESLKAKLEEGTSISTTERNFNDDPSLLYLQVVREVMELHYKQCEVRWIVGTIGSCENVKIDEVVEWLNEVEKFLKEVDQGKPDNTNSFSYHKMLQRIRKIRVNGPNFTTSSMATLPLRGESYCEIASLIKIHCAKLMIADYSTTSESESPEQVAQVGNFLEEIKLQLGEKIHEANSDDWYRDSLAKARKLIAKYEPAFSHHQSQQVAGLHEELRCEIRLLISLKCADLMAAKSISTDHDLEGINKQLQKGINEVNEFLAMIKLELEGEFPDNNSDWYRKMITKTRKLITKNYPAFPFQSQDVGSSSINMPMVEEPKAPVDDDMGYTKEQYLTSSLQHLQLQEGTSSVSMTEQNFSPLYLQVAREWMELILKQAEERRIADILGSYQRRYQNEKFYQLMEWIDEVDEFIGEASPEISDRSHEMDSFWCKNKIARIRNLRAKHGLKLTSQRVSLSQGVGSSSINIPTMEPLSLLDKLCCEITSLIKINVCQSTFSNNLHELIDEVDGFLAEIKNEFRKKIPETNSDWCLNKIAETRTLVAKWEPAFSLQSQDARSSSIALYSLHEELRCEIRSLINMRSVDEMLDDRAPDDHTPKDQYQKTLHEQINELDKFLTEINLQLEEKFPKKNSDWYRKKIAETRMLIAKRYSSFPLQSEDVGYLKEQYQIFLSFRGEDTRYGFTRNLYDAVHKEGFNVFMDDEGLQRGDSISQVLMRAIENSKLSIIVFSENFADSTWCLDEVVKILECKQKSNQQVWPIFYKVEPSDVRHQRNSYENAMIKQETKFGKDSDKVKNWRSALHEVCGLKAFHYKENSGYERAFIQDIIKDVKNIRDRL